MQRENLKGGEERWRLIVGGLLNILWPLATTWRGRAKTKGKRNRRIPSHSVGCLNLVEFLFWCYLVSGVLKAG